MDENLPKKHEQYSEHKDDNPNGTASSFEEAFEASGHGKFNIVFSIVAGLSIVGIIMESLGSSYILPAVMCEFNLSTISKGIFSSAVFIGIVTSSHLWGYLADIKGRKSIILPTVWLSSICTILSSFSTQSWILILFRCLTGFFLSAAAGNIFAYVGEMNVNSKRTKAITMVSFASSLGLVILPALAWVVLPWSFSWPISFLHINYTSWRFYLVICTIPNVVLGVTLFWYPESPKSLFVNGKKEKAMKVLRKIYVINSSRRGSEFPIRDVTSDFKIQNQSIWNQTIPLFKFPLLPSFLLTSFGQFSVFFLSSGFYLWIPGIFNDLFNLNSNGTKTVCQVLDEKYQMMDNFDDSSVKDNEKCDGSLVDYVYIISMIMGAIFCGCYLLIGVIINKVGQKLLLAIIMGAGGLSAIALNWVTNYYLILVLFCICLSVGCAGGVVSAIAVDLFPTQYRGMAMSLSLMVGRTGAVVGANLSGLLLEKACSSTFLLFGAEILVFTGCISLFPKPAAIKEKLKVKGFNFE